MKPVTKNQIEALSEKISGHLDTAHGKICEEIKWGLDRGFVIRADSHMQVTVRGLDVDGEHMSNVIATEDTSGIDAMKVGVNLFKDFLGGNVGSPQFGHDSMGELLDKMNITNAAYMHQLAKDLEKASTLIGLLAMYMEVNQPDQEVTLNA